MFFTLGIKFKRISGLFLVGIFLLSLIILSAPEAAAASKKGPVKRNGTLYFFNSKGKPAKSGRERKLSYKGKSYYVLRDGRIRKGWNVIGNDLYYFGRKSGVMQKNTVIAGITLLPDGKAQKSCKIHGKKTRSLDVSIRTKCIKVLKSRGVYNKSQAAQLRSAWTYLTNRKTFHYSKKYPNLGDPKWTKKYADFMLSAHRGNCYGFACTFAAFAWTIGYDPYVVAGRCPGGRDGARDGFTRHCVAKINGRWYDPEYWAVARLCTDEEAELEKQIQEIKEKQKEIDDKLSSSDNIEKETEEKIAILQKELDEKRVEESAAQDHLITGILYCGKL